MSHRVFPHVVVQEIGSFLPDEHVHRGRRIDRRFDEVFRHLADQRDQQAVARGTLRTAINDVNNTHANTLGQDLRDLAMTAPFEVPAFLRTELPAELARAYPTNLSALLTWLIAPDVLFDNSHLEGVVLSDYLSTCIDAAALAARVPTGRVLQGLFADAYRTYQFEMNMVQSAISHHPTATLESQGIRLKEAGDRAIILNILQAMILDAAGEAYQEYNAVTVDGEPDPASVDLEEFMSEGEEE